MEVPLGGLFEKRTRPGCIQANRGGQLILPSGYFPLLPASSFSMIWSIENDAGFWRGGKSL